MDAKIDMMHKAGSLTRGKLSSAPSSDEEMETIEEDEIEVSVSPIVLVVSPQAGLSSGMGCCR